MQNNKQFKKSMSCPINEKLVKLREERGFTQKEVAKHINITQQGYSAYERGSSVPPIDVIASLADFYDLNIDYILRDEELIKDDEVLYSSLTEALREVLNNETDRKMLEEFARYLLYRRKIKKKKN